jgi:hypothetical protein
MISAILPRSRAAFVHVTSESRLRSATHLRSTRPQPKLKLLAIMNRIFGTSSSKKPNPSLQDAISSVSIRGLTGLSTATHVSYVL